MSNNNKTLADAQPGGRVRLGDQAERARFEAWAGDFYHLQHMGEKYRSAITTDAWQAWQAALSAQPSPGGQDALDCIGRIEEAIEFRVPHDIYAAVHGELAELKAALAARQPVTMDDALVAGDGTLHGAIDHWQERALRAESELSARQPVGQEPVAIPEGWALVDLAEYTILPQIPTTAMMDAGWPIGEQITDQFDVKGAYADLIAEHEAKGESIIHGPSQLPAQAVDPADPWRGLYSPDLMPKLDGVNLYHVAHPDLPSWPKDEDEERGIGPLVTAQGFAMEVVFGEYPDDDGEEVDYCAWLASWTPDAPAGADWRMVCIQDTEDGPAAFYVRPLALIDSKAVGK